MLFSLSLNMIQIGVITVFAMSFGIGATLSIISIVTIKSKKIVNRLSGVNVVKFQRSIEWLGLSLLLVFSLFMIGSQY